MLELRPAALTIPAPTAVGRAINLERRSYLVTIKSIALAVCLAVLAGVAGYIQGHNVGWSDGYKSGRRGQQAEVDRAREGDQAALKAAMEYGRIEARRECAKKIASTGEFCQANGDLQGAYWSYEAACKAALDADRKLAEELAARADQMDDLLKQREATAR